MKILISVDMEGVAGITNSVQCRRDTSEFARSCELMTAEAVAAIEGARKGGATEIVVNDSHGDMRNIEHEKLPPDVRLIRGNVKPLLMVQGADPGVAGVVFIGYHAPSSTVDGICDHVYLGAQVQEMKLNGETCSEARMNAALVGAMNIPAICLSGDQSACADAVRYLPWIKTIPVKHALGAASAIMLSPASARSAIADGVAAAVRGISAKAYQPYRPEPPLTVDISLKGSQKADVASEIPGVQRVGGRTVRFTGDDVETVFKMSIAIMRIASTVD